LAEANSKTDSLFLIFGFCGALTSWSTLALDYEQQLKSRKYLQSTINLLANLIIGISAAFIGQSFA
jgi:fluoride ion exporter CrcB/FEX